jgi:4-amino-4-deoxychorismate lyase
MSNGDAIPVLSAPPDPVRRDFHAAMFAFYSSAFEAIITDPRYMQVPIDDHLVHRGDGVFETLKCVDGRVYCLEEHLDRLFYSAKEIALGPGCSRERLRDIIVQTIRAGGRRDCLVRVILSRGTGSMGISPADCPVAGLYVLVHKAVAPFMEAHPEGAHLVTSSMPVKAGVFATIKTCNYLPNALLKKEAIDRGADFAVNFDEAGNLAEGATENIGIVDERGWLMVPQAGRILPGTTMNRALALAAQGVAEGWLAGTMEAAIRPGDLERAREILIFGTTTNVTAVTKLNHQSVGDGRPGAVAMRLGELLLREQTSDNLFTFRAFA